MTGRLTRFILAQQRPERVAETTSQPDVVPQDVRSVRSEDLFQGRQEIQIEHAGRAYRLRITRAGKLILYK
jgi:hemin uptake protein HemP